MKQTNSSEGFILKLLLPLFLFCLSLISGVLNIDAAELSTVPDSLTPQGIYTTEPVISTEEDNDTVSQDDLIPSTFPEDEPIISKALDNETEITLPPQAELTEEPTEPSDTPLPVEYSLKVDANGGTIYMEEFGEYVDGYTLYRTVNSTAARYVLSDGREYSFEVADASKWGIVIPTPVLEGNYFQAWDNTNTSAVDSSNPNKVNQNLTKSFGVKAIWSTTPSSTPTPTVTPTPIIRKFTFDSDGGSSVATIYREKGEEWGFVLPTPTKKGYVLDYWQNTKTGTKYTDIYRFESYTVNNDFSVKAVWKLADYSLTYNLKGGYFETDPNFKLSYNIKTPTFTLIKPKRKYYNFAGWYTNSKFTGSPVTKVVLGSTGDKTFYAKWVKAKPGAVTVSKLTNPTGKIKITLKKVASVKGYQVKISTNKNFKSNTITCDIKNKTSYTYPNACKRTYYVKARAYAKDSTGNLCYGSYGKAKKIKVTKMPKEYTPTSTSGKLTSVKAISTSYVQVKAKVTKRLKSSDDFYYIVKVNPDNDTIVEGVIKKIPKQTSIVENVSIENGKVSNLMAKYALAVKKSGKYMLISNKMWVANPQASAANTVAYTKGASKKGIQGAPIDKYPDWANSNTDHTLLNLDLNWIIGDQTNGMPYKYNGKTYYFKGYYEGYIKLCNEKNINVSMVVLLTYDEKTKHLIHPAARTPGKNYYTLNTEDKAAREHLEAIFSYLGEHYGQSECYVSNWILGNEVNSHKVWNYAGNMDLNTYMKSYAKAFRMMYYGVKHGYSNAKCFISLDHMWNVGTSGFSSKATLDSFAKAIKAENKYVEFNIAFHAYPANLKNAAFWNDAVSNSVNTSYISPKNIEVLTNYVKNNFGTKTRIILSEQGFNAGSGDNVQAAALAYAYYKAEFNPMIDSFIIRSYIDHMDEVNQGLSFGMCNLNGAYRSAFYVYVNMNTPNSTKYTNQYLSTIGAKDWNSIIPGYNAKKFKSMKHSN